MYIYILEKNSLLKSISYPIDYSGDDLSSYSSDSLPLSTLCPIRSSYSFYYQLAVVQ
jgi:hypothetical protein